MKKALAILLAALLLASLGPAALAADTVTLTVPTAYFGTIGMHHNASIDEATAHELLRAYLGIPAGGLVFFDTLDEMLLALQSGRVDGVYLPYDTAAFCAMMGQGMTAIRDVDLWTRGNGDVPDTNFAMEDNGYMVTRDEALGALLAEALDALQRDGVLDALREEWVGALTPETLGNTVEMPRIDGGRDIVFSISGAVPPMDYVAADGSPTGYNAALLAKVAEHLGWNITLQVVDKGAEIPALISGRTDIIFLFGEMEIEALSEDVLSQLTFAGPYFHSDHDALLIRTPAE